MTRCLSEPDRLNHCVGSCVGAIGGKISKCRGSYLQVSRARAFKDSRRDGRLVASRSSRAIESTDSVAQETIGGGVYRCSFESVKGR